MANTFKRKISVGVGITPVTVYTVPANTTAVVIGMTMSNTLPNSIKIDVDVAGTVLVKEAAIPVGTALSLLDGKIVLETGDVVTVTTDDDGIGSPPTGGAGDFLLSIMEIT